MNVKSLILNEIKTEITMQTIKNKLNLIPNNIVKNKIFEAIKTFIKNIEEKNNSWKIYDITIYKENNYYNVELYFKIYINNKFNTIKVYSLIFDTNGSLIVKHNEM